MRLVLSIDALSKKVPVIHYTKLKVLEDQVRMSVFARVPLVSCRSECDRVCVFAGVAGGS